MRTIRFFLFTFSLLPTPFIAQAQESTLVTPPATEDEGPLLTADEPIEFDQETRSMTARGNAVLEDADFLLEADTIQFRQMEQSAEAKGRVRLNLGKMRVLGEEATYDLGEEVIQTGFFKLGQPPAFLKGRGLTATRDNLVIEDGVLFYNEPGPFAPNLAAETITYEQDGTLLLEDTRFRVGDFSFFALPAYRTTIGDRDRPFSLQTKMGFRNNLGAYVQNRIMVRTSPEWRVGGLLDGYTKRGVLFGPAVDYRILDPDHTMIGEAFGGFINDHGNRGLDVLNRPIDENRFFIEWKHQQRIDERWSATGRATWLSDSYVERDFRRELFEHNQQPDTFFDLTYSGDNSYSTLFTRPAPNDFYIVQQRLPELRFDLMPIPLAQTGLYQQAQASAVHLVEKSPTGGPELRSDRLDAYYGLSYPWTTSEWLTVKPVAGGRMTHYNHTQGARDHYTRFLGQVGFDAQADMYGYWAYRNEFWKIDGLRHKLRPIMSYRYIPKATQGQGDIPPIDRNVFSTYLETLDLGNRRDIDQLTKTNTLRFGVENYLQTRHPEYGSRDLAYLHLYQDYRFDDQANQDDWSDLYTTVGIAPAYWLDVSAYTRYQVEDGTLNEIRTRWRFLDGDKWEASIYTDNLKESFDQYYLDLRYRLNQRYTLLGRARYDAYRDEFTEQSIGLASLVGNAWRVEAEIEWRRGDQREDSVGFNIRVDLLNF